MLLLLRKRMSQTLFSVIDHTSDHNCDDSKFDHDGHKNMITSLSMMNLVMIDSDDDNSLRSL